MGSPTVVSLSPPVTWLQKLLWLSGCLVFFVVLYLIHHQFQVAQIGPHLEQSLHDTDRFSPGWRLAALEAARAAVPEEENSAFVIQRASQHLPWDWPNGPILRLATVNSCNPEAFTPWEHTVLTTERDLYIEALAEARELAHCPRGRHPVPPHSVPWNRPMGHSQQVVQMVLLLVCDAMLQSEAGDLEGAACSCQAALNAVRSLGDEPYFLTQMVRRYQIAVACRGVQHLLNHGVAKPETLAELQHQFEAEADHPAFAIAARGHRALLQELLEAIESGKLPLQQATGFLCPDGNSFWGAPTLDSFRQEHADLLPALARLVALAEKPPPERGVLLQQLNADLAGESFKLVGPLMRDLPNLENRFCAREALLRCTIVALAVERYRCRQGCWPDKLDDLKPDFLADTPLDPADGRSLRYEHLADGILVHSLCLDDYRNQYRRREIVQLQRGLGVRLWDVPERGRSKAPASREGPLP
jgi:hypothetical protein